jgi:hypothetical protein
MEIKTMYNVKFYHEQKNGKLKENNNTDYTSYKKALSDARKWVNQNNTKSAYIYSGIEESKELLTGIHANSVINHVNVRWLN